MDACDMASKAELMDQNIRLLQHGAASLKRQQQAQHLPEQRYCEDCGDEIPAARIKAAPETRRCIHCQRLLEESRN